MPPASPARRESFAGLEAWRLTLPDGDSVLVAEHGAQVLSWQAGGAERLYLSPQAVLDGRAAIRGGIPVCWPQFSDRGPLPKHGFARQARWTASSAEPGNGEVALDLRLDAPADAPAAGWPHAFGATLSVRLRPRTLSVSLALRNPGPDGWAFTGALHTYLAVDDIDRVALHGLGGRPGWDALTGVTAGGVEPTRFGAEFDRVYAGPAGELVLDDGRARLRVRQGGGWTDTVVWNPWQAKCATLSDMPRDGWRHMLCIEAARVFEPAGLPPGGEWLGWQTLSVD